MQDFLANGATAVFALVLVSLWNCIPIVIVIWQKDFENIPPAPKLKLLTWYKMGLGQLHQSWHAVLNDLTPRFFHFDIVPYVQKQLLSSSYIQFVFRIC